MRKLSVFLLGMVGLVGAASETADYVNFVGLIMFGTACILGVKYGQGK